MQSITRTEGSIKDDLEFKHDATGNRILKVAMHKDEEGNLLDATQCDYTYYVRDAGGNVMDVITGTGPGGYTDEVNLYGSSRLGTWQVNEPEEYNSGYLAALGDDYRLVGHKNYELTNCKYPFNSDSLKIDFSREKIFNLKLSYETNTIHRNTNCRHT